MPSDFEITSLEASIDWIFSQLCRQAIDAQQAQLRENLKLNPLLTQEQVDYKLQEARKQLDGAMQKFLKRQDWLLGWGLIVDYCKNSTSTQVIQEWSSLPRALKELFKGDSLNATPLQEALHLSESAMTHAYDASMKYYDAKDYSRALSILSCINFLNPGYFESWFLEGACHQQSGEWIQAIYSYSMALIASPLHALPYWYIAYCYYQAQDAELGDQFYSLAKSMQLPEGVSIASMETILHAKGG